MIRKFFPNLMIREKLILIITLTSAITLFLAFTAFSINDLLVFGQKQKNKLSVIAGIIANNSEAAVSFRDLSAAEEILSSLRFEPHIVSAGIYDQEGRLFAIYKGHAAPDPKLAVEINQVKQYYRAKHYQTFQPIVLDNKNIGLVFIKADTGELMDLIRHYFFYGFAIILACLGASFAIAAMLQRRISEPITALTQLAEEVSLKKNYSLRAAKGSRDEFGKLVDRFNEMLSEIEKRDAALVRSNRDLEQFAYVASHDLQEPLRMVINYVELLTLQWEQASDPRAKQFMGFIVEGAKRSQQLIKDLLEYSRVCNDEGKMREIRVEEIVTTALSHLGYTIEESKAVVTWENLPTIHGDPIKLGQVFQNLIGNAIKFRKDEPPQIHISAYKDGGQWIFSVRDNGIGIDPEFSERIFVIFKRLHTRETYSGTGIGLAICKRVIEQHGGRIWVEPAAAQGSIFHFTLPVILSVS